MSVKRILVVDDSKAARLVLRRMLQEQDLTVDLAESGEGALHVLASQPPDAILMDHTMPGMDGLQTVQAIRARPEWQTIPVAMYTSMESDGYVEQAKSAGAVAVLPKPATPETLKAVLQQLSEARTTAQQAQAKVVQFKNTAPTPVAPTSAMSSLSQQQIEAIIRQQVEQQLASSLLGRINVLLDERLVQERELILANAKSSLLELAGSVSESRIKALGNRLDQKFGSVLLELKTKLQASTQMDSVMGQETQRIARDAAQAVATDAAREISNQLIQAAMARVQENHELFANRLNQRLQQQFEALAVPRRVAPELRDELAALARESAAQIAHEAAREGTVKATADVVSSVLTELEAHRPSFFTQHWPALLAGGLGILTAIILRFAV